MTVSTLPSLRVLPAVEPAPTDFNAHWHLFGYYPRTRDVYRLVRTFYAAFDRNTPPTELPATVRDCTELALVFGVHWTDMVDQFRAARGRPRRAKLGGKRSRQAA